MSCKCKNKINEYFDASAVELSPWEEGHGLIGIDECGRSKVFEVPDTLSEKDREKVDSINIDGDGESALYDDGTYRKTYNSGQVDVIVDKINSDIDDANERIDKEIERAENSEAALQTEINRIDRDAVFYDQNNFVKLRSALFLSEDLNFYGIDHEGGHFSLIEKSGYDGLNYGTGSHHFNINSIDRPSIQSDSLEVEEIAYLSDVYKVSGDLGDLAAEYGEFKTTVNNSFNTVNESIQETNKNVSKNATDIEKNSTDIKGIIESINETEHFRGGYETTSEVESINNPSNGDFAYNFETNTIWSYDGQSWKDTEVMVPNLAPSASDDIPLVDGDDAGPGSSNEYARGDHRHPSDHSKADVILLSDYLPLAGNSPTTPVTGDIWLSSGNRINLSDSVDSFLGHMGEMTQLLGNGSQGVDIYSSVGPVNLVSGKQILFHYMHQNAPSEITMDQDIHMNPSGSLFYRGREVATLNDLQDYLPLSGGRMRGSLITKDIQSEGGSNIGTPDVPYGNIFGGTLYAGNVVPLSANGNIGSTISRFNVYSQVVNVSGSILTSENTRPSIGTNSTPFGMGYFSGLYINGEEVKPGQIEVVQEAGYSETAVMSQKAVSTALYGSDQRMESVVIGKNNVAEQGFSVVLGQNAKSTRTIAVSIGYGPEASWYGVAIGCDAKATGTASIAISRNATASGLNSISLGYNSVAQAEQSISIGMDCRNTEGAIKAIAIGTGARVSRENAVSIGPSASGAAYGSVALGYKSIATIPDLIEGEEETGIISIGSTGDFSRRLINVADGVNDSDAATVGQLNGLRDSIPSVSNNVGSSTTLAISQNAATGLVYADPNQRTRIKIGSNAAANSADAVAIGSSSKAISSGSLAIGSASSSSAGNGVAVGVQSSANGVQSVAIGYAAKINSGGSYGVSIGTQAGVSEIYSTALGHRATVQAGVGAVAVGANSTVTEEMLLESDGENSPVSVGSDTIKRRIINVAEGVNDSDAATVGQLKAVENKEPEILDSIGNSSTSAISQKAATELIYADHNYDQFSRITIGIGAAADADASSGIAIGNSSKSIGGESLAIGKNSMAHGSSCVSLGHTAQTWSAGVAIGSTSQAKGTGDIAIGNKSSSDGGSAIAIGVSAKNSVTWGISLGASSSVEAEKGMALGLNSSVKAGVGASAIGSYSTVEEDMILESDGDYGPVSVGSDTIKRRIINIAEGVNDTDAATVGQVNSSIASSIYDSSETNSISIGDRASAKGYEESVAVGYGSETNERSVAIGSQASVNATAVAIGFAAKGKTDSISIGAGSSVQANHGVAIGLTATVGADAGIAIGTRAWTSKLGNISIGLDSSSKGSCSISLGHSTKNDVNYAIALGNDSKVTVEDKLTEDGYYGPMSLGDSESGIMRRIINVREGVNDTDAATVGQIRAAIDELKDLLAAAGIDL